MTSSTAAGARIAIEHHTDLRPVRQVMLDVYADVRRDLIHLPHYSVDAYAERLDRHAAEDGWEAVIGYDGVEPVGYGYCNTVRAGDRWWQRMELPLPSGWEEAAAIAFKELGVRPAWRKTGVSVRLHDALLSKRGEERVTLLVNPAAGDGKVQALYASWGYEPFNRQTPSPGSPPLVAMARATRPR
ncbi:GNAT family N-acetyltransferase [Streptacidiphilus pinicola]|uniref:GNAT family N-acetyltransferase n=1 Tax=Streptacidiphilus pinicola TaxID=2219663 RepID=UPI001A9F274A|nr:GNAT family N-acetyltransferase [Streptacidiphilus pinicola]